MVRVKAAETPRPVWPPAGGEKDSEAACLRVWRMLPDAPAFLAAPLRAVFPQVCVCGGEGLISPGLSTLLQMPSRPGRAGSEEALKP